jgi:hypothetical protein
MTLIRGYCGDRRGPGFDIASNSKCRIADTLPHGLRGTWCPGSAPIAKLLGLYDLSLPAANAATSKVKLGERKIAVTPPPPRPTSGMGALTKTAEIPDWGYPPVAGGTILASPWLSRWELAFLAPGCRPTLPELQCVLICTKSRTAHRNALTAASPLASLMAASSVGAAQPEHFSATSSVPMTPRKPNSNRGQAHDECACRYGTQRRASAPERRAS